MVEQIDPHHTWNTGKPLRSKQLCGCHITSKAFDLCTRGKDLKKAADEKYKLWRANDATEVDATVKRSTHENFELHRDAYLRHLRTGETWVL